MNKHEFIAAIADRCALTKKDTENILNAITDIITTNVAAGEKIQLIGFGTFEAHERGARECINPRTKEKMTCAAKRVPVFKAGKTFKDTVAEAKPKKAKKSKK